MGHGFKWKWGVIIGSILLAIYTLVPTFITNAPSFFPDKGLNLGLDLRGGIYVEMEVLLDEGISTKIDLLGQDLTRFLKEKSLGPANFLKNQEHTLLTLNFASPEIRDQALRQIEKNYTGYFEKSSIENNDLHLTLDKGYIDSIRKDILAQAVQAVRNRIDRYGLAEPSVQRHGETKLVVELPGIDDPDRALKIIQQAGKLEFKLVNRTIETTQLGNWIAEMREANKLAIGYSAEDVTALNKILADKLPQNTEVAFSIQRDATTGKVTQVTPFLLDKTAYITGDMLKNAQVQNDQRTGDPYVSLTFNLIGAKNFADLTKEHVGELLAILLDGNLSSAPVIREPILDGRASIELGAAVSREARLQEAKDLSLVLQEGALPARLKELSKNVIGPTLGKESIQKSMQSMLIGTLLVILFMVVYYNLSGLLAAVALLVNTLFIFAALAMFQATLTLPGMAGIALTIGMAVDANVLIFERIREELKAGQMVRDAVANGYSNAVRAIFDSNLTTIIAGIILYQFGTGPIRGFAVTLIIGLICNIFTAVFMTRTVYDWLILEKKVKKIYV
ncbi:MAG: protein translocase subunit SecD [Deltaproteobacteria bacterium]|nr:protein translocase subunit SecD [Deltaproteobacteria bacterium]